MFTDLHCHILFDVDDGAKDLAMSLAMLEEAVKQNITHIVMTPHVQSRVTKASRDVHIERFQELQSHVIALKLPLTLYLGAEIHYRLHINTDYHLYTLGHSKYVLIEFSTREAQPIEDVMFDISRMGFKPILAHVERYDYLSLEDIAAIKEHALIQVNTSSILGFDKAVKQKYVLKLIKYGLVDIISTDAHNLDKRIPNMQACYDYLKKYLDESIMHKLFFENVKPILETMSS